MQLDFYGCGIRTIYGEFAKLLYSDSTNTGKPDGGIRGVLYRYYLNEVLHIKAKYYGNPDTSLLEDALAELSANHQQRMADYRKIRVKITP